jgi:hypothetical protein
MDSPRARLCGGVSIAFAALGGCAAPGTPKSEAIVSVSAVNYAEVAPGENVIGVVNGDVQISPEVPSIPKPTRPVYYLLLPGEISPSDVPMDSMYQQLRISLEHRGYYNAITSLVRKGLPLQVDYLLRLHYGVRPWSRPTVRADQVTWGDDGMTAERYHMRALLSNNEFDPRAGLSAEEVLALQEAGLNLMSKTGAGKTDLSNATTAADIREFVESSGTGPQPSSRTQPAQDFGLVVLEAFKFSDVKAMNRKAPCAWMIFIAVPMDSGKKLSEFLTTMLKTAEPYYGGTTQGLQIFEVPVGKVEIGEPVELQEKEVPNRDPKLNTR